ncbi:hypothetical protein [Rhizobium rhizogenes]|uniref:hypothetical protein n=1 Tax=Rhizobium rhizogenes TaxID=359 RepID=UPI0015746654|nr:hypothetical protein [Rhizobium rhizogenes]NTI35565.1 hypothetical protein [Rhizobium rhizogenes]WEO63540.1 hypothetical protein G6L54_010560 [Rhizobium rhizogenes]
MEPNPNAAAILFPNDAPRSEPPAAADAIRSPTLTLPESLVARSDNSHSPTSEQPTARDEADAAKVLFGNTADDIDYDGLVRSELDDYIGDAIKGGDAAQADALKHASRALADEAFTHDTDPDDMKQALRIVRQSRQSFNAPTAQEAADSYQAGMDAVRTAGITDADLSAARQYVAYLDRVAPGTIESLERHGAGNDPKLVQLVIREARRRGF